MVLCLPAALKVEDVHLRMTGQLKIGYDSTDLLLNTDTGLILGLGGTTSALRRPVSPIIESTNPWKYLATDGHRS